MSLSILSPVWERMDLKENVSWRCHPRKQSNPPSYKKDQSKNQPTRTQEGTRNSAKIV